MTNKFIYCMAFILILTACSGGQDPSAPQGALAATETEGRTPENSPTQVMPESGPIAIEGTVAEASPSAGVIMLMEPVGSFEVIAVTENTTLVDFNGNALQMNEVQRGMFVKADGTAGQGGAFIASHVILFPTSGMRYSIHPVLLTYLGPDGNVWVYNEHEQAPLLVTTEATGMSSNPTIEFKTPRLSSDGALIAVERQVRTIRAEGMAIESSLWVYEVSSRLATQIYDRGPTGFDWKPGSHLLAYSPALDEAYFSARGQVDLEYASSIFGYDHDTGATSEMVRPEGGFALARPTWSPSGRFLSFEEVQGYEGSGWFAHFDFESNRYASWGRAIGNYDWSPDEQSIIYDELTYTGSGTERIQLSDRAGLNSRQISPEFDWGYVAQPAFSPEGDFVTYLYYSAVAEGQPANVYVQQVDGGDPLDLGAFDTVRTLDWTRDDQTLVIEAAGPSGQQEILILYLDSSEIDGVAIGTDLSLAHSELAGEGLSDWVAAERALRSFFESLNGGRYAAAVDLYGGSYSTMRDHNPTIAEDNRAALLQAACEINGARCLATAEIRSVHQVESPEGEFLFVVQFLDEDGSIFSLGPCCGEDSGEGEAVSRFSFRVRQESEYHYVVLDPPIYAP